MAIQTQITRLLNEAEKTNFSSWKFDKYYKAAKLQVREGLKEEAKQTLDLARQCSDDKIITLCKLAKIEIMINPDSKEVPKELLKADGIVFGNCKWADVQPNGRAMLGSIHADNLATVAKRYFQARRKSLGNSVLDKAFEWAHYEGRAIEKMNSYYKIAKIHHEVNNKKEFLEIIKRMESYIPCLSERRISFGFAIKIARLLLATNKEEGQRFITHAERELKKIKKNDPEKKILESLIEEYCANEKMDIETLIWALSNGYSNEMILALYEKCKKGIENSEKEKTDELVYHLLYKNWYPDATLKILLEPIPKIPSRHLPETIAKKFSDEIILMVFDRVETREDILNIDGMGGILSPTVAEKIIAKKCAENDSDSLFAVDVALEAGCSGEFVLNLLNQVSQVNLSNLEKALEKKYSEDVIRSLVAKQETKQDISHTAPIAKNYGYSKEMVQFLKDVNKEKCIVM